MNKILAVLAVCLLALGVAIGQSSTGQQQQSQTSATQGTSGQQQQPSSQSQSQSSSQPQQDRNATASGSASGSVSTRQGDTAANPNSDQPARASSRTGLPLTWLIIGGVVLVLVIIALATRGSTTVVDRSDRVEHHDDIRRAS